MARGALKCVVVSLALGLTLTACASVSTPSARCAIAPTGATISAKQAKDGKTAGYFIDAENFGKLMDSLKAQHDYQDSLAAQARKGGCR